ncbi:unnamed protein product [Medioppia subpectinata]|uniref:Uncharacterized protein n=1 Tax=Medioppia subpectinata TaxID=1979941 RepID=A0A7R9KM04_9ACAR|nr:unnamed protein product [Medioppia subpectinata]CAG2105712.1 unnamed protein product [Medioppia subpectinata]
MDTFSINAEKANTLVDQFLVNFKDMFGPQIDPTTIAQFGQFKLRNMGNARIYDLTLQGVSNIQRVGQIEVHANGQMKLWSISANLSIANITASFKVDALVRKGLYITGWTLQALIDRCLMRVKLDYDQTSKMMTIHELIADSIVGFTLNTDNLSWPFSDVVAQIVDRQMDQLKRVISLSAQKYFTETLKSFNVSALIERMPDKKMF